MTASKLLHVKAKGEGQFWVPLAHFSATCHLSLQGAERTVDTGQIRTQRVHRARKTAAIY